MASAPPATRSDSGYIRTESEWRDLLEDVAEKGQVTELWNHRDDLGLTEQVSANIHAGAVEGGDNECYAVLGTGTASDSAAPALGFAHARIGPPHLRREMTAEFLWLRPGRGGRRRPQEVRRTVRWPDVLGVAPSARHEP